MPPTRSSIRTLNAPALTIFLTIVAAGTAGLFFAHALQRERLADALLQRAEDLAEQEKWGQAAGSFERYLKLRPRDLTAHVRLAETFDRSAPDAKPRAVELYYRAVGVAPERIDLRQRLATLLWELRRYPQAVQAADELLKIAESDETGLRIRALALRAQAVPGGLVRREDALAALETANRRYPGDIQVAEALAEVYRQPSTDGGLKEGIRLADAVMDRLVEAGDGEAAAHLARFRYRTRYGLTGAAEDLEQAASRGPDHPAVRLALGGAALGRGAVSEAADHFERIIQLAPQPLAFLGLGDCHAERGNEKDAIAAWTAGLEIAPEDAPLNLRLADALLRQKRALEALPLLNAAERGIEQYQAPLGGLALASRGARRLAARPVLPGAGRDLGSDAVAETDYRDGSARRSAGARPDARPGVAAPGKNARGTKGVGRRGPRVFSGGPAPAGFDRQPCCGDHGVGRIRGNRIGHRPVRGAGPPRRRAAAPLADARPASTASAADSARVGSPAGRLSANRLHRRKRRFPAPGKSR
jgi:tetratricopeptide (TPR) repeat protein